ncbi:antibiotic biosynthesis monooxygenase [Roseateles aquatilis]|uniref:Antibiotic biosynthesis monooxygenase n=1 Tax=Roseateles aquatilis TaxID=431061 RepID=A0A246J258_9BURK|nr:putative quinol monooxygenase [Roseateles aquatilis]OWQ86254.1 antibiotic biosynthesis monooxygenase [Roseateles aquatilis]
MTIDPHVHASTHDRPAGDAPLTMIAVLVARPGQRERLRTELSRLIEPTRAEPGCLDYVLFELRDEPGTFYMREAFTDEAALDAHRAMPHFRAFEAVAGDLLGAPLRLVKLDRVA